MRILGFLSILLFSLSVSAQWTVYNVNNTGGLNSGLVTSIIEQGGLIWFSTDKGVVSYNKTTGVWTNYNSQNGLGSNFVNSVKPMSMNRVLASTTGGGLSVFSGSTWTTYNASNGFPNLIVYDAEQDFQGYIWAATYGGGLGKFDGSWHFYNTDSGMVTNNFTCIYEDYLFRKWFGTFNSGVYMLQSNVWSHFTMADGLSGNLVTNVNCDSLGRMWICTNNGVTIWDNGVVDTLNAADGFVDGIVYQAYRASNNHMYLATDFGVYEWYNGFISHLTVADGLKSDKVYCVFKDSGGDWYYGHSGDGLSVKRASGWNYFDATIGLKSNYIYDGLASKNGSICIATTNGFSRFDNGQWTTWNQETGFPYNSFLHISSDNNDSIYLKPYGNANVVKMNGDQYSIISNAATYNSYGFMIDDSNHIWSSTYYSICDYSNGQLTTYSSSDGVTSYCRGLAQGNNGRIWCMSSYGPLYLENSYWHLLEMPSGGIYGYNNSMCFDALGRLIVFDDNDNRIYRYEFGSWTPLSPENYIDYVTDMIIDSYGRLIVAGTPYNSYNNRRLFVYDGVSWMEHQLFGILSPTVNSMFCDSMNNLWICTSAGVAFSPLMELGLPSNRTSADTKLNVYPNPASDYINILASTEIKGDVVVRVFSAEGRLVLEKQFSLVERSDEISLNLIDISKGIYLVQVSSETTILNSTFVKQ